MVDAFFCPRSFRAFPRKNNNKRAPLDGEMEDLLFEKSRVPVGNREWKGAIWLDDRARSGTIRPNVIQRVQAFCARRPPPGGCWLHDHNQEARYVILRNRDLPPPPPPLPLFPTGRYTPVCSEQSINHKAPNIRYTVCGPWNTWTLAVSLRAFTCNGASGYARYPLVCIHTERASALRSAKQNFIRLDSELFPATEAGNR